MQDCALQAVVLGSVCQQDGVMVTEKWTGEGKQTPVVFHSSFLYILFSSLYVYFKEEPC